MKKLTLLWFTIMIISMGSYAQTTAVDFTLTDCNGISRTLFPIIDSGNVVIMIYEHQCISCKIGANIVKNVILTNYSTATNLRLIYLDNGGFSCSAIQNWISSNSLMNGPAIAYSSDYTSPYGAGMPVVVVTGTKSHKVYLSAPPTTTSFKNAVESALTDISNGINSDQGLSGSFEIYPNPAVNDKAWIKLSNSGSQLLSYEISNSAGQIIQPSKMIKAGEQQAEISITGMENGIYFIYLNTAEGRIVRKLMINN